MKWEIRHRTLSQHENTLRKLWNQIRGSELNCLKIMFSLGTSSFLPVLFHPFPLTFWAAVTVHYIMIIFHLIYKFLRARNLNLHNQLQNCSFYTETLKNLDLFSLSKRLKGDLTTTYRCPHKEKKKVIVPLLCQKKGHNKIQWLEVHISYIQTRGTQTYLIIL